MTQHSPAHVPVQPELRALWSAVAGGEFKLHHVNVKGINTRVLEAGSGPDTLIFLHGIAGHLEAYMRNILPHAAHFRVLAIDMLGHGFTDKPTRDYQISDYVGHLHDLLDTLGLDSVHLSGESLGGWVAARFAALCHDLGKALTPAELLPRHSGHEGRGEAPTRALCERLRVPAECRDLALLTVRFHSHIHRIRELRPDTVLRLLRECDALRRPARFDDLLAVCRCDAHGRPGHEQDAQRP